MQEKLEELKRRLARIADIGGASGVLGWDQETYMPPGGLQARADQLSTLGGLAHEYFIDEEMGELLETLSKEIGGMDEASDDASLVRVKWREYQKAIKVPVALVMELYSAAAIANQAWKQARAENNFKLFEPHLEKLLDINIRMAEALGYPSGNPYDALLDQFEPDLTESYIGGVFGALKEPLVALIKAVKEAQPVDDSILRRGFDEQTQIAFAKRVIEALGFDFTHGRVDLSAHPFTGGPAYTDVRLTTRVKRDYLPTNLMALIHESGHGMHAQNTSPSLYRSTIEHPGLAICESQSRFYENIIGRSRAFWSYWFPKLKETFPFLADADLDTFYRAINKVEPGLIRVEADEVTYGLHIMLRFEMENEMVNGKIKVSDLPQIWNDRMEAYLGVRPPTDSDGVLQDVHWSHGGIGYFPDYLLGSILASQLWAKMQKDNPKVTSQIAAGKYDRILAWQREKVQRHGNKFTFPELVMRVTGGPLRWEPYMDYLRTKFGEIYGL